MYQTKWFQVKNSQEVDSKMQAKMSAWLKKHPDIVISSVKDFQGENFARVMILYKVAK